MGELGVLRGESKDEHDGMKSGKVFQLPRPAVPPSSPKGFCLAIRQERLMRVGADTCQISSPQSSYCNSAPVLKSSKTINCHMHRSSRSPDVPLALHTRAPADRAKISRVVNHLIPLVVLLLIVDLGGRRYHVWETQILRLSSAIAYSRGYRPFCPASTRSLGLAKQLY